ncbi:MAG TPA: SDR family oxidoreductase [Methylomirabilota bacterium]|nr:SDR family oxidoreductase [Methylomirabilota bacterium]
MLPEDLFDGRVVFITGGGSGINLGIARAFAALGADLAICGRSAERLEGAAAELEAFGAHVVAVPADVRDFDALVHAMEASRDELGPLSVLVCGAAGNFPCPAEQLSANGFKAVVDIDLLGSFNACRAAFEQLAETRGSVTFISAGQAFIPYPAQVHVGAAKAGVDHLMRNLALEWGRYGIRCNSIAPGPIEGTEGMRRLGPDDPSVHDRLKAAIPLGRYGTVDEIGAAAVFLASPLASYITGTLLVVDGGQNLAGSAPFAALLASATRQER